MPTTFPVTVNQFDARLAADYTPGQDAMTIRPQDIAALEAAGFVSGAVKFLKFTVVKAAALDAQDRLTDPTAATVYIAVGINSATNQLVDIRHCDGTTALGPAADETPASADQAFFAGDIVRCAPTAGMLNQITAAINVLENSGVSGFIAGLFGTLGEYKPPLLVDSSAADGSVYFGVTHPDPAGRPQLCRKQDGIVTVIG